MVSTIIAPRIHSLRTFVEQLLSACHFQVVSEIEMVLCGAHNLLENGNGQLQKKKKCDKFWEKGGGTGSSGVVVAPYRRDLGIVIRKEWGTGLEAALVYQVMSDCQNKTNTKNQ